MNLLAIIANYDKDEKARMIADALPCSAIIVDSSGKYKKEFIATNHPFGAGCFNKAMDIFLREDYTHCLCVCSDVTGDWTSLVKKIKALPDNIGMYSPSVVGAGWKHQKPIGNIMRDVPFCEGMIYVIKREVAEKFYYCDPFKNKHSYATDILHGYIAQGMGLRVVIDDSITFYHPPGKGYSKREGERQMKAFVRSKGADFLRFCQSIGVCIPFYTRYWRKLLSFAKLNKKHSFK